MNKRTEGKFRLPDSEDHCLFKFLSEKVIRVTPQIEAHLTFLRGLDKRDDIEVIK